MYNAPAIATIVIDTLTIPDLSPPGTFIFDRIAAIPANTPITPTTAPAFLIILLSISNSEIFLRANVANTKVPDKEINENVISANLDILLVSGIPLLAIFVTIVVITNNAAIQPVIAYKAVIAFLSLGPSIVERT